MKLQSQSSQAKACESSQAKVPMSHIPSESLQEKHIERKLSSESSPAPTMLDNLFGSTIRHVVHSVEPWCAIRLRDQQCNALFGLRNFVRICRSGRASSRHTSTEVRMNSPNPSPKSDHIVIGHNTIPCVHLPKTFER